MDDYAGFQNKFLMITDSGEPFSSNLNFFQMQNDFSLILPNFDNELFYCDQDQDKHLNLSFEDDSSKNLLRQSCQIIEQYVNFEYQSFSISQNLLFNFEDNQDAKSCLSVPALDKSTMKEQQSKNSFEKIVYENKSLQLQCSRLLNASQNLIEQKIPPVRTSLNSKLQEDQQGDEFNFILHNVDIKTQIGKNTNLPKYLIRLLQGYFQAQLKKQKVEGQLKERLDVLLRKILRIKYCNSNKNLFFLSSFLRNNQYPEQVDQLQRQSKIISRRIMRTILRDKGMIQIIKNNRVTTKKTILIGSKVFSLRCMMSNLTQRLESS